MHVLAKGRLGGRTVKITRLPPRDFDFNERPIGKLHFLLSLDLYVGTSNIIRNISSGIAKKMMDSITTTKSAAIGDSIAEAVIDINQYRFCFRESRDGAVVKYSAPINKPPINPTTNPKPRKNMFPNRDKSTDFPPYIPPAETLGHQVKSADDVAPMVIIAMNRVVGESALE